MANIYREFYIDGANFDTPDGFFEEVARATARCTDESFARTAEGFYDLVHSGALLERSDAPVRFTWSNFDRSEERLPKEFLDSIINAARDEDGNVYPCYLRIIRSGDNPYLSNPPECTKGLKAEHFFIAALFLFCAIGLLNSLLFRVAVPEIIASCAIMIVLFLLCSGAIYKIRNNSDPSDRQIRLKIFTVLGCLYMLGILIAMIAKAFLS